MSSRALKLALLLTLAITAGAQKKYWIGSEFQTEVSLAPCFCSQWLQQCSYILTESELAGIRQMGIAVTPVLSFDRQTREPGQPRMGFALEQIGGNFWMEKGLDGTGVRIGIIDGGFLNANGTASLRRFFDEDRVAYYRDFITPDLAPYTGSAGLDDGHGTDVWTLIGGYHPDKNVQFGLATGATYYLARTDHGGYEKRQEEDLLIQALEEFHRMGIRLVNVSLGYSKGFTNPQENYLPADMDGKTSAIARAVDTAFFRKNMLIVVSAGNEGDDHSWRVLSTPGDARGALSVGATKLIIWDKIGYSSEGTPTLDYIKPEIACFSASGTSFSAPVLTGLAAGIFQYDSTRTAAEVKQLIMASGHLYPYGNDRLGYGVPRCDVLWQLLTGHTVEGAGPQVVHADNDRFVIRQQWERNYIVAYHKGHDFHVLAREVFRPTGERLRVRRFNGAGQTTLLIGDKVMEIIWEH